MSHQEQTVPVRMCRLCEQAPARPKRRVCTRCSIAARLEKLLDDGTGRINPELEPLARLLVNSPTPESTLVYLHKGVTPLLRELASGRLPISHDGLRCWHQPRTAAWLRDLLITCQVLPEADRILLGIESWLYRRLETLAGHPYQRLLRQYALWQQLPKLRATAQRRPLRPTAYQHAWQQFTAAETFCTWLVEQQLPAAELTQRDLDAWYATSRTHQRLRVRSFLTWAIESRRLPTQLSIPVLRFQTGRALTQQRRLELLHRYLHHTTTPIATRAAVCLLLLFAQPLSRILRLTVDDITYDDHGGMLLRLGEPPTPVPEPFAALLTELAANRENLGGVPTRVPSPAGTRIRHPRTRPASPRPRGGRRARVPPNHHRSAVRQCRQYLEPLPSHGARTGGRNGGPCATLTRCRCGLVSPATGAGGSPPPPLSPSPGSLSGRWPAGGLPIFALDGPAHSRPPPSRTSSEPARACSPWR